MTSGVYERSPEEKERLRGMVKKIAPFVPKGIHLSPRTEFKKGSSPWNKGKEWSEMRGDNHPSRNPKFKELYERIWKQPKGIMKGKDHPQWKGGKTPLILKIRSHKKSITWRDSIFARDNYTCQVCGDQRGHNLNAHHYSQLSDIVHTLNITSVQDALNAPVLWNLSNGVTLCTKCHAIANEASKAVKIIYGGRYE